MNLFDIMKRDLPLLRSLAESRVTEILSVRPLVPNRVKLLYSPDKVQPMYPGFYVVLPEGLLMSETHVVYYAIQQALNQRPERPDLVDLDVPNSLARKFAGRGPDTPPRFNRLWYRRGRLRLRTAHCVLTNPNDYVHPVDLYDPAYGTVCSVPVAIMLMQTIAALLCLHNGPHMDSRDDVARRSHKMILSQFPKIDGPDLLIDMLGDMTLRFGTFSVTDFNSEDAVNSLCALLYSFINMDTSIGDYIRWR